MHNKYNRGEIYEITINGGKEIRKCVIVSAPERENDFMQSIVMLGDKENPYTVPVVCGDMMDAKCDLVSYATADRLLGYVRTVTDAEMAAIDSAIVLALGIELEPAKEVSVAECVAELQQFECDGACEEVIRLRTEAELYKKMYETLLDKLVG